jgi:predicted nucleic acid-binding protein
MENLPRASVVVDSNIFIGLLRRGGDPVCSLAKWIGEGDLVTCGMIRLEVERGLRFPRIRKSLGAFFDVMINVPTSNKLWEAAVDLAWNLDRRGVTLPAQDILIAACALSSGSKVLTDDAHFRHIPGLVVVKPAGVIPGW